MGEPISAPVTFVFNDATDVASSEGAIAQGLNDSFSGIITSFQLLLAAAQGGKFDELEALFAKKAAFEESFQAYTVAKKSLEEFKLTLLPKEPTE